MDGTLWDSAAEVAESWNETVKRAGYDRKTDYGKGHPISNGKDDGCDRTDSVSGSGRRRTPETSGTVWGRRK